jgi:hypothetical protein
VDRTIQNVLRDSRFYELMLGFDRQIAESAHAGRCRRCGAKLHWGSFGRKPRGVPVGLGPEHLQRFSLCCAADGCRKVFLDAMVVLISAMQSGLSPARVKRLQELLGVSRRTVARWRDWWCSVFTESSFWRVKFDFLGYGFRPRLVKRVRDNTLFCGFNPAVSVSALKAMRILFYEPMQMAA